MAVKRILFVSTDTDSLETLENKVNEKIVAIERLGAWTVIDVSYVGQLTCMILLTELE